MDIQDDLPRVSLLVTKKLGPTAACLFMFFRSHTQFEPYAYESSQRDRGNLSRSVEPGKPAVLRRLVVFHAGVSHRPWAMADRPKRDISSHQESAKVRVVNLM